MKRYIVSARGCTRLLCIIIAMLTPTIIQAGLSNAERTQLNQLFTILNINLPNNDDKTIIETAKESWGRKEGVERWQMKEVTVSEDGKQKVIDILKTMGFINEIEPKHQHYDHVLILGATAPRMEKRLNYFISLIHKKKIMSFNELAFLVGARPLNTGSDQITVLKNKMADAGLETNHLIMTESGAAATLWAIASQDKSKPLPDILKKIVPEFVNTPMKPPAEGSGEPQRPNTEDTLKRWLESKLQKASTAEKKPKVLAISNQPHALYQLEVVKRELEKYFEVDIAADTASSPNDDQKVEVVQYLNALTLWLQNRADLQEEFKNKEKEEATAKQAATTPGT